MTQKNCIRHFNCRPVPFESVAITNPISFVFLFFVFNVDFNMFAQIYTHNNGKSVHRRLYFNGYRFGVLKSSGCQTVWRCTLNSCSNQLRRCNGSVATKLIGGYEMIMAESTSKLHTCRTQQ